MKKTILLFSLLLTFQCGYKATLTSNSNNFEINEIKINQKQLSGKIINRLKTYQNKDDANNTYNLEILITEKKIVTLKDSKGIRVKVDDKRLSPIWNACAELNIPVLKTLQ